MATQAVFIGVCLSLFLLLGPGGPRCVCGVLRQFGAVTFGGFLNAPLRASTAQLGFYTYSNTTVTNLGVLSQTCDQA